MEGWFGDLDTIEGHERVQESQKLVLGNIFDDCRVPAIVDNGEVFLSQYLACQVARNEQESEDPLSKQCCCSDCRPLTLPTVPTQEVPNAAALPLQAALPQRPVLYQPFLQTTSAKCCFDQPPYYCPKYYEYLTRKAGAAGQSVLGKPLHDYTCPSLSTPFSFHQNHHPA
jgi:hypothetical protein